MCTICWSAWGIKADPRVETSAFAPSWRWLDAQKSGVSGVERLPEASYWSRCRAGGNALERLGVNASLGAAAMAIARALLAIHIL